jgi:hypothetical protein
MLADRRIRRIFSGSRFQRARTRLFSPGLQKGAEADGGAANSAAVETQG